MHLIIMGQNTRQKFACSKMQRKRVEPYFRVRKHKDIYTGLSEKVKNNKYK